MKKVLLLTLFSLAGVGFVAFSINSNFKEFINNQLASVIGINIVGVHDYQKQLGMKRELAMGDSGKDVELVQEALYTLRDDFPQENITGYFGKETSRTISEYQKDQGLPDTGKLDSATLDAFNAIYFNELCPAGEGEYFRDDILIQVNKSNGLPSDYVPQDLINISSIVKTTGIHCIKKDVVPYLQNMMEDALDDNIELAVTSGFRRPEIQGLIYKIWTAIIGERVKDEVAEPLHSEHQLGTTIDFAGATNNFIGADDMFGGTPEDAWLKENSYKYGFVMSYPENKTEITGYVYEPWHYRFVGIRAAKTIHEKQISVEEYFSERFDLRKNRRIGR